MVARTKHTILDHSSSTERAYAQVKDRKQRYKLVFSKVTANWTPKCIKEIKTKLFLNFLLELTEVLKKSKKA